MHDRLSEFDLHRDIGQVMLDRLERSDRLAKLLALRGVVNTEVEHALGQPDELRADRQPRAIDHAGPELAAERSLAYASRIGRRPLNLVETTRLIDARIQPQLHLLRSQRVYLILVPQQQ